MERASKKRRGLILDAAAILFGSIVFAAGFDIFLDPNNIAPGGVTGIAMIINSFAPVLPVGTLIILINLPLFALGWKSEGHGFLLKSVAGTVVSSVFIDLFSGRYIYTEDPLMSAIYGGVLMGLGLGVINARGATTGGTDIAGRLLLSRFPSLSFGRLLFIVDLVVITAAAIVYRHVSYALYAVISVYISTTVVDAVISGTDNARVAYIITGKTQEVVSQIDARLGRGATLLKGEGTYTGEERSVIMCAVKRRQVAPLKELVKEIDSGSFLIITDAHEVLGDGFVSISKK